MRIAIACLGICLLPHCMESAEAQVALRHRSASSQDSEESPNVWNKRSRVTSPEMLIFQRAQRRAQERSNRIATRQRLGLSKLRPGPIRYWRQVYGWPRPAYVTAY